jgi:hypothetical protein
MVKLLTLLKMNEKELEEALKKIEEMENEKPPNSVKCTGCNTYYEKSVWMNNKYGVCSICFYYLSKYNNLKKERKRILNNLKENDQKIKEKKGGVMGWLK